MYSLRMPQLGAAIMAAPGATPAQYIPSDCANSYLSAMGDPYAHSLGSTYIALPRRLCPSSCFMREYGQQ